MPDKNVVLITNIPNQYRIPLFNEFSKILSKEGKRLHVIFGAISYSSRKTEVDLTECQFDFTVLQSDKWKFLENGKGFIVYENLLSTLERLSPHQIVIGGFSLATIKICLHPKNKNIPIYLWSGAISNALNLKGKLRAIQRKWILNRVRGVLAYSHRSKLYFVQLGVSESKISVIGNTVDVSFFKAETERLKLLNQPKEVFHLTYLGYLTKRKAVDQILQVFEQLAKLRDDIHLNIVGSGEEEIELKNQVKNLNLGELVTFHGFIQKELIPAILAKSDLFLYQTNFDIWGLVLNETMAAGVPCFASVNAVSTNELIEDNKNGFKVNFAEHQTVAKRIDEVLHCSKSTRIDHDRILTRSMC
ncbi:MAG: glycosyltransferase involved in cell wall biosynthesis [Vicingaceae bacterium]|jgi:glycosyltransferase involved in cell wall biosynthesis